MHLSREPRAPVAKGALYLCGLFAGPATNLPSLLVIGRYSKLEGRCEFGVPRLGHRSQRRSLAPVGPKLKCRILRVRLLPPETRRVLERKARELMHRLDR
jgi:hypothetical protein